MFVGVIAFQSVLIYEALGFYMKAIPGECHWDIAQPGHITHA
jgi:hypothetical protein